MRENRKRYLHALNPRGLSILRLDISIYHPLLYNTTTALCIRNPQTYPLREW